MQINLNKVLISHPQKHVKVHLLFLEQLDQVIESQAGQEQLQLPVNHGPGGSDIDKNKCCI